MSEERATGMGSAIGWGLFAALLVFCGGGLLFELFTTVEGVPLGASPASVSTVAVFGIPLWAGLFAARKGWVAFRVARGGPPPAKMGALFYMSLGGLLTLMPVLMLFQAFATGDGGLLFAFFFPGIPAAWIGLALWMRGVRGDW